MFQPKMFRATICGGQGVQIFLLKNALQHIQCLYKLSFLPAWPLNAISQRPLFGAVPIILGFISIEGDGIF